MTFSTDADLLTFEPTILKDAAFASQTLVTGDGAISNTSLSVGGASLSDAGVQPGNIVILGEPLSGCFPVVSVDSSTALTLSVVGQSYFDDPPVARFLGSASSISFSIRSFFPQRAIIAEMLLQAAGLDTYAAGSVEILNPQAMNRASTLGTLQLIFASMLSLAPDRQDYVIRMNVYGKLFRRAIKQVQLNIKHDGLRRRIALNTMELLRR